MTTRSILSDNYLIFAGTNDQILLDISTLPGDILSVSAPATLVNVKGTEQDPIIVEGGANIQNIAVNYVKGRTIPTQPGMTGEMYFHTVNPQTFVSSATYTNLPLNVITPTIPKGSWYIILEGNGISAGGTSQYRLVQNDGTSDTVLWTYPIVSAGAGGISIIHTGRVESNVPFTVRLQVANLVSGETFIRAGVSIRLIRINWARYTEFY
jgi:hypothetical protein